jgi:hypothetical protein
LGPIWRAQIQVLTFSHQHPQKLGLLVTVELELPHLWRQWKKKKSANSDFKIDEANVVISKFDFEAAAMAASEDDNGPSTYDDRFDVPSNFQEVWHHEDSFQRKNWIEAIWKECKEMLVWRKIARNQMPQKRRCVKSRWVFDIKGIVFFGQD